MPELPTEALRVRLRATRISLLDDLRGEALRVAGLIATAEEVGWHWLAHELRKQHGSLGMMVRVYEETLDLNDRRDRP